MGMGNKLNFIYHFKFKSFLGTVKNVPSDMNIISKKKYSGNLDLTTFSM